MGSFESKFHDMSAHEQKRYMDAVIEKGDYEKLAQLLPIAHQENSFWAFLFFNACCQGNSDIFDLIFSDQRTHNCMAEWVYEESIRRATEKGHLDHVEKIKSKYIHLQRKPTVEKDQQC